MRKAVRNTLVATSLVFAIGAMRSYTARQPAREFIAGPRFFPDGQRVVFAYANSRSIPSQLHAIRLDGTDERTLTSDSYSAEDVRFSPDGHSTIC